MFKSLSSAVHAAEAENTTLAAVALAAESRDQGRPVEEIRGALRRALAVMRSAIERGLNVGCTLVASRQEFRSSGIARISATWPSSWRPRMCPRCPSMRYART
jgi:L-serine deaminase